MVTGLVTVSRTNRTGRLTESFVKSVARAGRYGNGTRGYGLSILVKKTAHSEAETRGGWSKTWSQRIRIGSKVIYKGLGAWPVITYEMACAKALDNLRRVALGEDIRKPPKLIPTVDEAFNEVITTRAPTWEGANTLTSWRRSQYYCSPIGTTPVSEVSTDDILKIIEPLWHKMKSTPRQIRAHLAAVMDWAIARDHRTRNNPARPSITKTLGKQAPTDHVPSLPHTEVGQALAVIRDSEAWWSEKACLMFLALTCVRSGEARGAVWEEINLAEATWTIPAHRMKARFEHRVPLSSQAIAVLMDAQERTGRTEGFVFPPHREKSRMRAGRLTKLMHQLEIPAVPHGFRASNRNWAGIDPSIIEYAAEMVLAHRPSKEIVKAYLTEDFFEQRQPMMQDWADYLSETMGSVIAQPDRGRNTKHPKRSGKSGEAKSTKVHGTSLARDTTAIDTSGLKREEHSRQTREPAEDAETALKQSRTRRTGKVQTHDRKAYMSIYHHEKLQRAKDEGKCRHCSNPSIPGQTRCETCAEEHRVARRKSEKARRERKNAELISADVSA